MDVAVLVHGGHLGHKDVGGLAGLDALAYRCWSTGKWEYSPLPRAPTDHLSKKKVWWRNFPARAGSLVTG